MSSFLLPMDTLRRRRNSKWTLYPDDVLPSWVADMDFSVAEPVQAAIARICRDQDYGYARRNGLPAEAAVADAFAARMQERFGWSVDPGDVQVVTDLIQALTAVICAFSEPGDGVVVQTPCYPPFRSMVADTGRRFVDNPMRETPDGFVLDLDQLEAAIDDRTRIIVVCNPQNPTGRVFTRDELTRIAGIAEKHDLVVFCDEIHADLVYPGGTHIPIASLGQQIAGRTVTATSATKSFNLPGLRCGVMHFGSKPLRERFHERIPGNLLGKPSIVGNDATVAAWTEGQPWLDEVMAHLLTLRDDLAAAVARDMPGIRMHVPEATFLAWLDCSGLGLDETAHAFFMREARIGFSAGESFCPRYGQWVRFNFGTTREVFDEKTKRMARAVAELHAHAGA